MQINVDLTTACLVIGLVFLIAVGITYGVLVLAQGRDRFLGNHNKRQVSGAVEVKTPVRRFNYDLQETRHEEITRRLDQHDREIKEIQQSRAETLEKINGRIDTVIEMIGELKESIGEVRGEIRNK